MFYFLLMEHMRNLFQVCMAKQRGIFRTMIFADFGMRYLNAMNECLAGIALDHEKTQEDFEIMKGRSPKMIKSTDADSSKNNQKIMVMVRTKKPEQKRKIAATATGRKRK